MEKGICCLSGCSSFVLSVGKQNKRQRKKMKEAEELRGQNLLLQQRVTALYGRLQARGPAMACDIALPATSALCGDIPPHILSL